MALWTTYVPFIGRSNKVRLKLLKDNASETLIDLDALSGLAEISLETEEGAGIRSITKLGVSTGPPLSKVVVPSQVVTMVPRHVVINESGENIIVRQCYLQVMSWWFLLFSFSLCVFYLFVSLSIHIYTFLYTVF